MFSFWEYDPNLSLLLDLGDWIVLLYLLGSIIYFMVSLHTRIFSFRCGILQVYLLWREIVIFLGPVLMYDDTLLGLNCNTCMACNFQVDGFLFCFVKLGRR